MAATSAELHEIAALLRDRADMTVLLDGGRVQWIVDGLLHVAREDLAPTWTIEVYDLSGAPTEVFATLPTPLPAEVTSARAVVRWLLLTTETRYRLQAK